jgi:predicted HicB family RNase H-like nuclease
METKPRLVLDVDQELHKDIKLRATERGLSIKKWILQAIAARIEWERKYQ